MPPQRPNRSRRVRLQSFMSDAGVASRRKAEALILEGRVLVNDEIVDELPVFVDPDVDRITVNGTRLRKERLTYFILNKPAGVVCTNRDPAGRTRAIDLLPPGTPRLFVVGRLDVESTGLVLLTNDGELAERIAHPRFGVAKSYRAEVAGRVKPDLPERMKRGVHLSIGKATAEDVEIVHAAESESVVHITLREGRNRQVRRMLARLGHKVRRLKRLSIGPLTVRSLPMGAVRRLTATEVEALRAGLTEAPKRKRRPSRPKRTSAAKPRGDGERKAATGGRGKKAATGPRDARATGKRTKAAKAPPRPGDAKPRRRIIT